MNRPRRALSHIAVGLTALYAMDLQNPAPPPPHRRWTFPAVALALPLGALAAILFANNEVEWRGQRLRIAPGGRFERLP